MEPSPVSCLSVIETEYLLNRSIIGTFHQLSVQNLPAYLDEFEFRFNNRENPYIFREAMRLLLDSENVEYKELVS